MIINTEDVVYIRRYGHQLGMLRVRDDYQCFDHEIDP
jgi:hypothetical protein